MLLESMTQEQFALLIAPPHTAQHRSWILDKRAMRHRRSLTENPSAKHCFEDCGRGQRIANLIVLDCDRANYVFLHT